MFVDVDVCCESLVMAATLLQKVEDREDQMSVQEGHHPHGEVKLHQLLRLPGTKKTVKCQAKVRTTSFIKISFLDLNSSVLKKKRLRNENRTTQNGPELKSASRQLPPVDMDQLTKALRSQLWGALLFSGISRHDLKKIYKKAIESVFFSLSFVVFVLFLLVGTGWCKFYIVLPFEKSNPVDF